MRFLQFCYKTKLPRLGIQLEPNGKIVDLNANNSNLPNSLLELIRGGNDLLIDAKK